MEKALLLNQLVIMESLLTITKSKTAIKDLEQQIVWTRARLRALI